MMHSQNKSSKAKNVTMPMTLSPVHTRLGKNTSTPTRGLLKNTRPTSTAPIHFCS